MGQVRHSPAVGDWLLFVALAAPHALYAYIWFFPGHWRAMFRRSPVSVFATVASLLKGSTSCCEQACCVRERLIRLMER